METVPYTAPSSNAIIPAGTNGGISYGGPARAVNTVTTPSTVKVTDLNANNGVFNVPAPTINASSFGSFVNSLNAGMGTLQNQEAQQQSAVDKQLSDLMAATKDVGNKGIDYLAELNTPEYKAQQQALNDANLRFAQTQTKFNNDYFANEGKGYDTSLVQGLQALNRTRAAVELGNQATVIQALQGNIEAAKKTAEETINAKYMVKEADLNAKKMFYEANKDKLTGIQKKLADQRAEVINASLAKLQAEKDMQKFNATLAADLFKDGKIDQGSFADLLSGSSTVIDVLKKTPVNVATISNDPLSSLQSVIKSSGAKTDDKLKLTGSVIAATQDLAKLNQSGDFAGLGPIRAGNITISQKGQTNRTYLASLKGTVESWMTGASVAEDQRKRIEKDMIPKEGDIDKQVRQKLNALTNYMLSYAKGNLATQGIKFDPIQVDLFTIQQDPLNIGLSSENADPLGLIK